MTSKFWTWFNEKQAQLEATDYGRAIVDAGFELWHSGGGNLLWSKYVGPRVQILLGAGEDGSDAEWLEGDNWVVSVNFEDGSDCVSRADILTVGEAIAAARELTVEFFTPERLRYIVVEAISDDDGDDRIAMTLADFFEKNDEYNTEGERLRIAQELHNGDVVIGGGDKPVYLLRAPAVDDYYVEPIASDTRAGSFLHHLKDTAKLFHLDDDPASVIASDDFERVFTDVEAVYLRQRIAEVKEHLPDAYEVALALLNGAAEWTAPERTETLEETVAKRTIPVSDLSAEMLAIHRDSVEILAVVLEEREEAIGEKDEVLRDLIQRIRAVVAKAEGR